jgi:hypothetical protein
MPRVKTQQIKKISLKNGFSLKNIKRKMKNGVKSYKATIDNDGEFWGEMDVFANNKTELKELAIKRLKFQGDL